MQIETDVTYTLTLNKKEFGALKALVQNPHEAYQDNEEMMEVVKRIWDEMYLAVCVAHPEDSNDPAESI